MSFLDYLGLVSLREHNHAMERVRKQRDDETIRANKLAAELAALRPDAEKHRARVEKAKLNLKQNREKV